MPREASSPPIHASVLRRNRILTAAATMCSEEQALALLPFVLIITGRSCPLRVDLVEENRDKDRRLLILKDRPS